MPATGIANYRDDFYQKYINESAMLPDEIATLRRSADYNYNQPVHTAPLRQYSYPLAVPQPVYTAPVTAYQPAAATAASRTINDTV